MKKIKRRFIFTSGPNNWVLFISGPWWVEIFDRVHTLSLSGHYNNNNNSTRTITAANMVDITAITLLSLAKITTMTTMIPSAAATNTRITTIFASG